MLQGVGEVRSIVSSPLGEVWESAASDPDPNSDLGYELRQLEFTELQDEKGGKYMLLPREPDRLRGEEFVIVDPGSVCLLEECR